MPGHAAVRSPNKRGWEVVDRSDTGPGYPDGRLVATCVRQDDAAAVAMALNGYLGPAPGPAVVSATDDETALGWLDGTSPERVIAESLAFDLELEGKRVVRDDWREGPHGDALRRRHERDARLAAAALREAARVAVSRAAAVRVALRDAAL